MIATRKEDEEISFSCTPEQKTNKLLLVKHRIAIKLFSPNEKKKK